MELSQYRCLAAAAVPQSLTCPLLCLGTDGRLGTSNAALKSFPAFVCLLKFYSILHPKCKQTTACPSRCQRRSQSQLLAWHLSLFLSFTLVILFRQGHFLLINLARLPSQNVFIKTPIRTWSLINHNTFNSCMDAKPV